MGFPACVFLLLFCMNLYIRRMYLSVLSFMYKVSVRLSVCIFFNLYTVRKILCGITQLDVGDVTQLF
jgi:hypothetical protein